MPVNSITSSQPVQATQVPKKTDAVLERKQNDTAEADKAQAKKTALEFSERVQKSQEPAKTNVNANGQTTGTRINTTA